MVLQFDKKIFKIIFNEGPDTEVTSETLFFFQQQGNVVHADYSGGGVVFGKLLGILEGYTIRHHYMQLNKQGEFNEGFSTVSIQHTAEGKMRLIDTWEWKSKSGKGYAIFEEV